MDNQPNFDPSQPQEADNAQPGSPSRSAPGQSRPYAPAPFPSRPTFRPPPGYQAQPAPPVVTLPPQNLPQPVVPGQTPYYPPPAPLSTPPTYQLPLAPPPKKRHFLWLGAGVLLIVILVVAAGLVWRVWLAQPTKAPQRVSDQFISDLQKDDPTAAYGLTSAAYQKTYSAVYFKKIVDQVSSGLQGPASVSGSKISKNNSAQATVVYKIPTQYTTQYIKVTLENAGTWQVDSFAASTLPPADPK